LSSLQGKIVIPPFISPTAADLIRKLLRRCVDRRLGPAGVKEHKFFSWLDWDLVVRKAYQPPHLPQVSADDDDASQFDPKFTSQQLPKMAAATGDAATVNLFADFEYVRPDDDCGGETATGDEVLVLELSVRDLLLTQVSPEF
jgi:hypothetical protein